MSSLKVGDTLDTFVIDRILHGGAMASIYRARDLLTGQTVVLKVPLGDIFNHPVRFYHYQNEERIGRYLDHPGVVRFFYRRRSRPYIVLEYLEGRELRTLVGPGRTVDTGRACRIIVRIARVLEYLHKQGICHLDLKPENIILAEHDFPRLLDFGLASRRGMEDLLAEDFPVPHGTPYYIAPEQLQTRVHLEASDIYSLGVLFYEMLTGHLPFPRSRKVSVTRWRLKVDPVPPRWYEPDIPPQLQQIILTCLARDSGRRYGDVGRLIRDLDDFPALPVTEAGRQRRRPWQWLAFFLPAPSPPEIPDAVPDGDHLYQVLGTVINDDTSDAVVEIARRRTLLHHGQATLLFVIEEEGDMFVRYSREVEGERFRHRLERYIQLFRHYNLDPTVRLVRGEVVETIIEIAERIRADLIVLGPPRRRTFFSQSVIDAVISASRRPVLVATGDAMNDDVWTLPRLTPAELTAGQVLSLDLFLIDCWFDHVEWLADLALALVQEKEPVSDRDVQQCCLARWLDLLRSRPAWQQVAALLEPVHDALRAIARDMRVAAHSEERLRQLYLDRALPCACRFRRQLQRVSTLVRQLSGNQRLEEVESLSALLCPVYSDGVPTGGPLLQLHTLREYMLDSRLPPPGSREGAS
ncbi:MAG TPA: hypothetical protein ENI89_08595 [Desulfobulbus sp.]|nr:hypothetical protein [Desulfobulbus sp.]